MADILLAVAIAEVIVIAILMVRLAIGPSVSDRIVALNTIEYVGEATAGRREQRRIDPHKGRPTSAEAAARRAEAAEESETGELIDPDATRLGALGPERSAQMTVVVRVAARAAAVVLAVAAIYLAAWGYAPGGGFPAGAALAGVAVLLYAALGYRAVRGAVRPGVLEPLELAGAAAIIAVELLGLLLEARSPPIGSRGRRRAPSAAAACCSCSPAASWSRLPPG